MKYMLGLLLFGATLVSAGDLQTQLEEQLDKGELTFSKIEAALIAEGASDAAALESMVTRYDDLVASLKLTPKQAKGKAKKKAKILHKAIFGALKIEGEEGDGLTAILQDKAYTPISATMLLADLAARENMTPVDWSTLKDKLEPTYVGTGASPDEALAAMLSLNALHRDDADVEQAMLMLRLAKLIAPDSAFNPRDLDKHFYNRGLKLFNDGKLEKSAQLAMGAGTRFPKQELYNALTYNIAVKLVNGGIEDSQKATGYARKLFPFMGQYQAEFSQVLDSLQYNLAANLYNEKKYERAMVELERVKNPPNPENFKRVLSSTYSILTEQYMDAGKQELANATRAKLEKLDPARAEILEKRMAQLKLKDMVESGDMDKALSQAAANLGTEVDRQNYKSVLVQFSQGLRAAKEFDRAFALLKNIPADAQVGDTVNNLRFNTYSDWLDTFEDKDYKNTIPIYRQVMADKELTMTPENKKIMHENYANMLHLEIVKLIEERHFNEANNKSKAALKIAPNHKALQEQRQLVETIMRRISE